MRLIDADAMIDKYGEWYTEEGTEEGFIGTLKGVINMMPTIEPRKWIPFTADTTPKEDGEYFVLYDDKYAEDYDTGRVGVADFYEDCEAFGYWQGCYDSVSFGFVDSYFVEIKVKKWMPIPKEE